jgi:hypothetical protein
LMKNVPCYVLGYFLQTHLVTLLPTASQHLLHKAASPFQERLGFKSLHFSKTYLNQYLPPVILRKWFDLFAAKRYFRRFKLRDTFLL